MQPITPLRIIAHSIPLTPYTFTPPLLHESGQTYVHMRKILDRYGLPYDELTGEQIVYDVAEKFYQGLFVGRCC